MGSGILDLEGGRQVGEQGFAGFLRRTEVGEGRLEFRDRRVIDRERLQRCQGAALEGRREP